MSNLVEEFLQKERELFGSDLVIDCSKEGKDLLAAIPEVGCQQLGASPKDSASSRQSSDARSIGSVESPPKHVVEMSPPAQPLVEPEELVRWRNERAAMLGQKDAEEHNKVLELHELAQQSLANIFATRDATIAVNKVLNRVHELKRLTLREELNATPDWNTVSQKLMHSSSKHNGKDASRMKSAILSMVVDKIGDKMASPTRALPRKMGLVVAMDLDGGIAKNGKIPWTLRKDMEFFKKITSATTVKNKRNAVIMGRKCWESIPEKFRPLKDRLNIVISRTMPEQRSNNLIVSSNFDEIMNELSFGTLSNEIESIWNIGGTEIYHLALEKDLIDRLIVTKIDKSYGSDLMLKVDWHSFVEMEGSRVELEESDTKFAIHFYSRR